MLINRKGFKMKKISAIILCFIISLITVCHGMNGREIKVNVTVNGDTIFFKDQQPVLINSRTLLPIRSVAEAMGKSVEWSAELSQVRISDSFTSVNLIIGNKTMIKTTSDGSIEIPLDVAPIIINERTCMPVRAVAEAFMAEVTWEEETQTVIINTAK